MQMMVDTRRSGFSSPESRDARDSLDYSGFLHKRRGGFGKYALAGLAWQERFVTISKLGLLTYYEGDPYDTSNDDVKEKPRGRIDLRTVDYEFLKDIRSEVSQLSRTFPFSFPLIEDERFHISLMDHDFLKIRDL